MILGIGIDIIEVDRIRTSFERFGERFLKRILRPDEIGYCLSHKEPAPFLAARVIEPGSFARLPVNAREIADAVTIAREAGPGQITEDRQSAVLFGNEVVGLEPRR